MKILRELGMGVEKYGGRMVMKKGGRTLRKKVDGRGKTERKKEGGGVGRRRAEER